MHQSAYESFGRLTEDSRQTKDADCSHKYSRSLYFIAPGWSDSQQDLKEKAYRKMYIITGHTGKIMKK